MPLPNDNSQLLADEEAQQVLESIDGAHISALRNGSWEVVGPTITGCQTGRFPSSGTSNIRYVAGGQRIEVEYMFCTQCKLMYNKKHGEKDRCPHCGDHDFRQCYVEVPNAPSDQ